jgi:hypothetical protein
MINVDIHIYRQNVKTGMSFEYRIICFQKLFITQSPPEFGTHLGGLGVVKKLFLWTI